MNHQEIQKYLFALGPERAREISSQVNYSVGMSTDGRITDGMWRGCMVRHITALKAKQEQIRCYQCGKIVSDAEQHVTEYGNKFMWVCS